MKKREAPAEPPPEAGPMRGDGPEIAVYYEHPDWFRPLFRELDRRGVEYARLHAVGHRYDPTADPAHAVVLNRMSPSAHLRLGPQQLFYTEHYLRHLEGRGVRVINGTEAWRTEISKARQIGLLDSLELAHPRTRVLSHPGDAPEAAEELGYPVVLKPNVGGSGAGVRRFDSAAELERAAEKGELDGGVDHTLLVQELIPARGDRIVRVEVLDGSFLYGIRIYTKGHSFNLCPADLCEDGAGEEPEGSFCPTDAPRNGLRVEGYTPPSEIVEQVQAILRAGGIEIGGVEYMVDDRNGRPVFYDINALSNFVADAPRVVGFDPFERLAGWLEKEAELVPATA